jgi:peptidyl-prolyl cis-trans isomerase B (cyclophilin B)
MKKFLILALVLTLVLIAVVGCSNQAAIEEEQDKQPNNEVNQAAANEWPEGETHQVAIDVKDYGRIVVELNSVAAPITVANFLELANDGFYDGLTFHRIIDGFMIQGGSSDGKGMAGSDKNIKGEFEINGIANPISHVRGVISMARTNLDMDSASSQFFIMHQDNLGLDGEYAAFGRVIEGMEIVDRLATETPVTDGNGTVEASKQPIIEKVTVLN